MYVVGRVSGFTLLLRRPLCFSSISYLYSLFKVVRTDTHPPTHNFERGYELLPCLRGFVWSFSFASRRSHPTRTAAAHGPEAGLDTTIAPSCVDTSARWMIVSVTTSVDARRRFTVFFSPLSASAQTRVFLCLCSQFITSRRQMPVDDTFPDTSV